MQIKPDRLLTLLRPYGFTLAYADVPVYRVVYVRRSNRCPAFEQIIIHCTGARGEAVPARVACSVVPGWTATRGLILTELILEIAGSPEKGVTYIRSEAEAIKWESQLASIASDRAREFANRSAQELLATTANARMAVDKYMSYLDANLSTKGKLQHLQRQATPEQQKEAARLTRIPGVMLIPDGWDFYDIAMLCLVLFGKEVDVSTTSLNNMDSTDDNELFWTLQILASRIAKEPGWE